MPGREVDLDFCTARAVAELKVRPSFASKRDIPRCTLLWMKEFRSHYPLLHSAETAVMGENKGGNNGEMRCKVSTYRSLS